MAPIDPAKFGKVAVLMGGWSAEREVSLKSGAAVLSAMQQRGIDAHAVDVQRERVVEDLKQGGFDRAFNILHGPGGEDGVMQGVLEVLDIPYTGSGVMASALAMDKLRTKQLLDGIGLPTPNYMVLDEETDYEYVAANLGLPVMVKPAQQGSSIGMSKVDEVDQLHHAYHAAAQFDGTVIAEQWVHGKEYTVAILGDEALPAILLETPRDFYDFEAKYQSGDTQYICPCDLGAARESELAVLVQRAYTAFGEPEHHFRSGAVLRSGVPIRSGFERRPYARAEGPLRLLVLGGSQGARALNEGVPEALGRAHTEVRVTPVTGKAILVSGHDLRDLEELLKQTEGKGINVYTHGEMLPANAYPGLKKYRHLVGNYGTAWQNQRKEFEAFPGAILMTTNCIQKPKESYSARIFTSGIVGWPGTTHVRNHEFGPVIEAALAAPGFAEDAPEKKIVIGFGRNAVLGAAERVGAWVLSDEVYAGAERDGAETPSLFGRYERVIATGSLSKAYGLQGLRVGWAVAPSDLAEELWARKDYTTISPGLLTDTLATLALRDDVRPRLLDRARTMIREGYEVVERWVDDVGGFRLAGHEAGAVCYPAYELPLASAELADRLRTEKDVLVVPGAHFDMGKYLRIGLGVPRSELEPALARIGELVAELA